MKKFIIVIFLIISIIQVRMYPYQTSFAKVTDCNRYFGFVNTLSDLQISQNAKKEYKFPQMLTVGAIGMGETIAGFTLAEVLITLLIVGIVSSIVIPAIIQDTQNAELKTAWKKAYSDLAQVTRKSLIDFGGSFKGVCQNTNPNCLKDIYIQHLSYIKQCNKNYSYGNCWHNIADMKWLNGPTLTSTEAHALLDNSATAVLNNGNYVMIYTWADSCNTGGTCGWIMVDVNGSKPPNTLGKDIFGMSILSNRIMPYGYNDGRTCNPAGDGLGCAKEYLK